MESSMKDCKLLDSNDETFVSGLKYVKEEVNIESFDTVDEFTSCGVVKVENEEDSMFSGSFSTAVHEEFRTNESDYDYPVQKQEGIDLDEGNVSTLNIKEEYLPLSDEMSEMITSREDMKDEPLRNEGNQLMDIPANTNHVIDVFESKEFGSIHYCNTCNIVLPLKSSLDDHLQNHEEEKVFKCSYCEKEFMTKKKLIFHLRIHEGIRPFQCTQCKKDFTRKQNLIRHMKIHVAVRPFKCNICEKKFLDSSQLKRHQTIHDEHRPFKCNHCDKSYTCTQNLNRHRKIHEEILPFKCSQCEKAFTEKSKLNRHLKVHKSIAPYKLPLSFAITLPLDRFLNII